jgi:predicted metal-dependent phosphoesterase TrpH
MIDLHMHSIFSDGTFTPEELVAEAVRQELTAVALTDHDTVKGVPRYLHAARTAGVRAIAGVELSTDFTAGSIHMLGYFVDRQSAALEARLQWIRDGRHERNLEILDKLKGLGIPLSMEEVRGYAGDEVVGRPHFAQALVARGVVKDKRQAFDRYLARGKPGYARRPALPPDRAIEVIRQAGGVPVLAHPVTVDLDAAALRDLLVRLREAGLEGLEVWYPEHRHERQQELARLASDLGLVATGGSDFHGAATPDLIMGRGFGSLHVPDEIVGQLESRRPA